MPLLARLRLRKRGALHQPSKKNFVSSMLISLQCMFVIFNYRILRGVYSFFCVSFRALCYYVSLFAVIVVCFYCNFQLFVCVIMLCCLGIIYNNYQLL